ncbi:hypothetical protein Hamer_G014086, partial [Homarus americanus]
MFLRSDMASQWVTVAYDIAGTRVVPDPVVTRIPTVGNTTKLHEDQYPGLFLDCVASRSMSLRHEQNTRVDPVPNVADTSGDVCDVNDFGIGDLYVSQDNSANDITWEEHTERLRAPFTRLSEYNFTVNLAKSEFGHATLPYLGH